MHAARANDSTHACVLPFLEILPLFFAETPSKLLINPNKPFVNRSKLFVNSIFFHKSKQPSRSRSRIGSGERNG
jgi:hypothetical protein